MKQPPTRWFQALWFALHLQAAALAQIAVVMHLASAEYHRRRIDLSTERRNVEPSGDSGELNDLSFADAMRNISRRNTDTD